VGWDGGGVALNFAGCRWPVGGGGGGGGLGCRRGGGGCPGPVAGSVIAESSADASDAVPAEPFHCSLPEPGSGRAALVGEFFGVGQPGVVVGGRVQVDVTGPLPAGSFVLGGAATVDSMAAAIRNAADCLDVHVDHVARPGPLVTMGRFAQVLPVGGDVTQVVDAPAHKDPMDRRGRHAIACCAQLPG